MPVPLALITNGIVAAAVAADGATVNVLVVAVGPITLGAKVAVTPLGTPSMPRVTSPWNPPDRVMVRATVPLDPAAMEIEVGVAPKLNAGAAAGGGGGGGGGGGAGGVEVSVDEQPTRSPRESAR